MNRLWEIWIWAMKLGVSGDQLFFDIGDTYSPYAEVSLKSLKPSGEREIESRVAVNPFFSWNDIFSPMLDSRQGEYDELTRQTADMILHHLAEIDSWTGMSKEEFYVRFVAEDLENGVFGGREIMAMFCWEEKKTMASAVLALYRTGKPLWCLAKCLRGIYPKAQVSLEERGGLLIFMNRREDGDTRKKLEFVLTLFLDMESQYQIFWEQFPGIIGEDSTMEIGDFMIG